jgi:arylformamidase
MKRVDLTRCIEEGMTTFHTELHSDVVIRQLGSIEEHGRDTREITLGTHTGTHLDAPLHFIENGETVENLPLDGLMGPVELVDFSHLDENEPVTVSQLENERISERMIFRFGWEDKWGDAEEFYNDYPYLTVDAATYLVNEGVKMLGFDVPSPDSSSRPLDGGDDDSPVHKVFLGNDVILVEYLKNLDEINSRDEWRIAVLPLKIRGADGAPARVVAWKE